MKCITRLREIQALLQEMLSKYERQLSVLNIEIVSNKTVFNKSKLLSMLRKRKLIQHYASQCEKKIENLVQKEYALEQLGITAMQVEALKGTTKVLKSFTKTHDIDRLEKLQDDMEELQGQIMDIDEALKVDMLDIDEDELEAELEELQKNPEAPVATVSFPVVPENVENYTDKIPLLI